MQQTPLRPASPALGGLINPEDDERLRQREREDRDARTRELELQSRLTGGREEAARRAAAEETARQREFEATQRGQGRTWQQEDIGRLPGLLEQLGGGGAGGSGGATLPPGGLSAADRAWTLAREREGTLATQGARDLRSLMSLSGNAGGGLERRALAGLVGATQGRLTDVATSQAQQEAERGYEVEDRTFQAREARRRDALQALLSIMGSGRTLY